MGAEQENVDQARDHGRDREGQVDEGDQQALAAELELGDRPGGGDAEDQVRRDGDGRHQERQADRRQGVALLDGAEIGIDALAERFDEHRAGRQHQHHDEIGDRDADQDRPDPDRLADGVAAIGEGALQKVHAPALSWRRAQRCSRFSTSSMRNEKPSITTAIAAAPA